MIFLSHSIAIEALALAVAAATVCRLSKLNAHEHKPVWIAVYFGVFCGAVAAMYEAFVEGPTWTSLLLLSSLALFLWASRHSWRDHAPRYLNR